MNLHLHRTLTRPFRSAVARVRTTVEDTAALARTRMRDETGAQAAEYALLGGVSATACAAIVVVIDASDLVGGLVGTLFDRLGGLLTSWF